LRQCLYLQGKKGTSFVTNPAAIQPLRIDQADIAPAQWDDPARGTITWKTLMSGDVTATNSLVCGIAIMQAGDTFALHSHPQAEVYFGLEGAVDVWIDGSTYPLTAGVALFIPGSAVHGVLRASGPVRWFYTFAADRFDAIAYTFLPPEDPRMP
jgi:quercetin dioxygenase-like cupin family protein